MFLCIFLLLNLSFNAKATSTPAAPAPTITIFLLWLFKIEVRILLISEICFRKKAFLSAPSIFFVLEIIPKFIDNKSNSMGALFLRKTLFSFADIFNTLATIILILYFKDNCIKSILFHPTHIFLQYIQEPFQNM